MNLEQYSLTSRQALRAEYPQQPLRGQVALVTGGNSGIVADIQGVLGQAAAFRADVSDAAQVLAMYDAVRAAFGTLDSRGLGASHQTGWTAVVAKLIDQLALSERRDAGR